MSAAKQPTLFEVPRLTINLLDDATARRAMRASRHAQRVNERLKRDVPLLLHAGIVAPITTREAAARIDRREVGEADKKAAGRVEGASIVALWERCLTAIGATVPSSNAYAPQTERYRADRLHNVARGAVPWVFCGGRLSRCERCGSSARGVGEFRRDSELEAAFLVAHAACEMPAHDGGEAAADIVIDHNRSDGTTVWPNGGHWLRTIAHALGPRAEWGRAYGKPFVPVIGSRRRDAPNLDVMALAAKLLRAGARVHVTPQAATRRCDSVRTEAA